MRHTAQNTQKQARRGFTLVETIVVTSLFALMMLVIANSIGAMYRYNAYTIAQAYQVRNARLGIQSLVRDIREMTFADNGSFPLVEMEDHLISFYSDIDRDDSVEYVEYELIASTTLHKRIFNATGSPPTYDPSSPDETYILSEYVQNIIQGTSTFAYYDNAGTEITSAADLVDVRYVEAKLIINIDPIRDPGQYMLRSSASLRNVKDNL